MAHYSNSELGICHVVLFHFGCVDLFFLSSPISCDRQHLSYDGCLNLSGGKREDYQNCSVLYCVLKLCTMGGSVV